MDTAISVERLGKRYRLGMARSRSDGLVQALASAARRPLDNFRRLRRLSSFQDGDDSDVLWALRDVSFDVKRGEVFGVVGRNGAGKSTLLKILARITEPSLGRATVRGSVGSLLEVGTGFHPELTGRDNVYFNGAILGMDKGYIERSFDEIVAFAGVERFIDTPVKRYSSGMKVRLAFAVAAHLRPEVLIIDEVLAVGDIGFQRKCLGQMRKVATDGRTVLFVSHNMGAVRSLCHRCVLLENGELTMEGSAEAVVDAYTAKFTEALREPRPVVRADQGYDAGYALHRLDGGGEITIRCGDPLTLEFALESPVELPEASVGITLLTPAGDPVVGMSSKVQNVPSLPGPARSWRVRCALGALPLNAGTYVARVYLGDGSRDVARFSDAVVLQVVEHDVFGWGNKLPPVRSWGSLYWAPEWSISPAEAEVAQAP